MTRDEALAISDCLIEWHIGHSITVMALPEYGGPDYGVNLGTLGWNVGELRAMTRLAEEFGLGLAMDFGGQGLRFTNKREARGIVGERNHMIPEEYLT